MRFFISLVLFINLALAQTYEEAEKIDIAQGLKVAWPVYVNLAKSGNFLAQRKVSYGYKIGYPVKKDTKKATYWFLESFKAEKKKAENGDFNAQAEVGKIYYYGDLGVEQNTTQGLYWYTKAAEHGFKDKLPKLDAYSGYNPYQTAADIQYKLAALYKYERGIENQEKGKYWSEQAEKSFLKLAQTGDAHAQWSLAVIYRYSTGMRDPIPWIKKAASQGHRLAIKELATIEK